MNAVKGLIVKAVAGRDNGKYFVILEADSKFCLIADGKIAAPKRKSIKHLRFTENVIDLNDITDKKLRRVLSEYSQTLNRIGG